MGDDRTGPGMAGIWLGSCAEIRLVKVGRCPSQAVPIRLSSQIRLASPGQLGWLGMVSSTEPSQKNIHEVLMKIS